MLFAGLAERVGRRTLSWPATPTVGELEEALRRECSGLAEARFRVAVNQRYAGAADSVAPGDEVALIPPVSGG